VCSLLPIVRSPVWSGASDKNGGIVVPDSDATFNADSTLELGGSVSVGITIAEWGALLRRDIPAMCCAAAEPTRNNSQQPLARKCMAVK
jgi:hypothetical protein